jgi:hypothetical protein
MCRPAADIRLRMSYGLASGRRYSRLQKMVFGEAPKSDAGLAFLIVEALRR